MVDVVDDAEVDTHLIQVEGLVGHVKLWIKIDQTRSDIWVRLLSETVNTERWFELYSVLLRFEESVSSMSSKVYWRESRRGKS